MFLVREILKYEIIKLIPVLGHMAREIQVNTLSNDLSHAWV